jgi:predicted metalloprotease
VFAASFLAACGGGDTEQAEGNKSGGGSSDKQGDRTPTSTEQQDLQVFKHLPKAEPAQPGETLRTRIVPDSQQGEAVKAQVMIFPGGAGGTPYPTAAPAPTSVPEQMTFLEFVELVRNDLNEFWTVLYQRGQQEGWLNINYSPPELQAAENVSIHVVNAPGCQQEGLGPTFDPHEGAVYCSENYTVYIPANWRVPSTNRLLQEHGSFALAYVVAHEWGHHLQNLSGHYDAAGVYDDEDGHELQADCLAGVWLYSAQYEGELPPGAFDEALNLASALGDDALGVPLDEQGDHGTSSERDYWLKTGYQTGDPRECWVLQSNY